MRVELGQHAYSSDGQDIGSIKYLILDPASCHVKTLVVEKGWLLPEDVEIPLEAVQADGDAGLHVRYTAEQIKDLPRFDESQYRGLPLQDPPLVPGYPIDGLLWPNGSPMQPFVTPGYPLPVRPVNGEATSSRPADVDARLQQQDEENAVISEGDAVFSQDGEMVGHVHRLVFDSTTGRPISMIVRHGWPVHEDREFSADAIASVDDGVVYLSFNANPTPADR